MAKKRRTPEEEVETTDQVAGLEITEEVRKDLTTLERAISDAIIVLPGTMAVEVTHEAVTVGKTEYIYLRVGVENTGTSIINAADPRTRGICEQILKDQTPLLPHLEGKKLLLTIIPKRGVLEEATR